MVNRTSAPTGMRLQAHPLPGPRDEEEMRRNAALYAARSAQATRAVQAPPAAPAPVNLAISTDDMWGNDGKCLGLKILCGVFALIVVILVVVLVVRLVKGKAPAASQALAPQPASPSDVNLPMSLAGGFRDQGFMDESLMSTVRSYD